MFAALKSRLQEANKDEIMEDSEEKDTHLEPPVDARILANCAHKVVFRCFGDPHVLSYMHVTLVFIRDLITFPEALEYVVQDFPWKLLSLHLNALLDGFTSFSLIESKAFPEPDVQESSWPLPEDFAMRGLLWSDKYFPRRWFDSDEADDGERYFETTSLHEKRKKRVLYLACRIAAESQGYLKYDSESQRFSVTPRFDIEIPGIPTRSSVNDPTENPHDHEMPDAVPS